MAIFVGELSTEERRNKLSGDFIADHTRAEHEHVHVIVFDSLMGGVGIMAEAGAHTRDLVGGNGCANAASADQNPALGAASHNRPADGSGDVWVVNRLLIVRADVIDFMAQSCDKLGERLFQLISGVIGSKNDAIRHLDSPSEAGFWVQSAVYRLIKLRAAISFPECDCRTFAPGWVMESRRHG
jgi:hypothetical protein